jgi:hypothetical protein
MLVKGLLQRFHLATSGREATCNGQVRWAVRGTRCAGLCAVLTSCSAWVIAFLENFSYTD